MKLIHLSELSSLAPVQTLANTHLISHGFNILFGPSGAYKSFYMLHQALTIAQDIAVVYVAAEGASGLYRRVSAWSHYYQKQSEKLYFLCQEINLLSPEMVSQFVGLIEPLKPQLVIFDTLARCMVGGDENSAKDTGKVINNCARIQRQLKTGVTLVHHSNRAERGERGSGAMRGAADLMIEMNNSDGLIKVICSKPKDSAEWPTESYRFHPVLESGILIPSDFSENTEEITVMDLEVIRFLSLEVFSTAGATTRQIQEGTNIPIRTLYRILSKLKMMCHIQQDSKGDPYRLLSQGKDLLLSLDTKMTDSGKVITFKKIG